MRYGARLTHRWKGWLFTALATTALLAMSAGTALAQGTISNIRVSLTPATPDEGGSATATATFRLTADEGGTGVDASPMTVGFAFHLTDLSASPRATPVATDGSDFIGLTTTASNNTQIVQVSALRAGRTRDYTVTHTFGLNHDLDAVDEQFKLTVDVGGTTATNAIADPAAVEDTRTYTINDDEEQLYTLSTDSRNDTIDEGSADTMLRITADPKRLAGTVPTFTVVGPTGFFTPTAATTLADLNTGLAPDDSTVNRGAPVRVDIGTIGSTRSDRNRVDDTVTLQLYIGGVGDATVVHELSVTVTDIHKLPAADDISAVARDEDGDRVTEIMEGGDPVYLTVSVYRGTAATRDETTAEDLRVAIRASSGQGNDVEIEPVQVELPPKNARGTSATDVDITLMALDDEDVGTEDLVVELVVSGMANSPAGSSTGTFTIPIVDNTAKKIEPKASEADYDNIKAAIAAGAGDDHELNPGETVTLQTDDLFTVAEGYVARYAVSVEGDAASASASGSEVTINAMQAGEAKITVTGTARHAGSSLEATQTVSNIAELTFPVTVVDKELVVTLELPENAAHGNVVEGQSYDIAVSANRMITEAEGSVEVTIMRDRAASDADDSDYTVGSATIMAGYDSATAELMVTADDVSEGGTDDGGNVGEQLVLFGVANGEQTNDLTFTIWDVAVPALPVIATWLLGLGLLGGGARQMYLRRRQD